jgi:hypothetical protein
MVSNDEKFTATRINWQNEYCFIIQTLTEVILEESSLSDKIGTNYYVR